MYSIFMLPNIFFLFVLSFLVSYKIVNPFKSVHITNINHLKIA